MKPTAKELVEAAKSVYNETHMEDLFPRYVEMVSKYVLDTVRPDDDEPVNDHAIQADGWFCRDGVWLHPDNQSIAVVIVDNGAAISIGSVARGVELRVKSMGHLRRLVAALGK